MLTGVTSSGFEYEITDDQINNFELVDALAEFDAAKEDGEKTLIMSKVSTLMLGPEQKQRLFDHLRAPNGNVPIDRFIIEMQEIITSDKAKN